MRRGHPRRRAPRTTSGRHVAAVEGAETAKHLRLAWVGLFVVALGVVALLPTAIEYAVMAGITLNALD
jgi:hypothetical protein